MIALFLLFTACTPEQGNFTGTATWRDSTTDASGAPKQPEPVTREDGSDQAVTFTSAFKGTGTFADLADLCLPTDGGFTGTSSSEGTIGSDGQFAGQIDASGSGTSLMSTLGCVTESLDIQALTSITIVASIEADTENCTHYCEADARAECEQDADRASCETDLSATCEEECTTEHDSITAETTIDGGAELEAINSGLNGTTFGSFSSDLTFDSME